MKRPPYSSPTPGHPRRFPKMPRKQPPPTEDSNNMTHDFQPGQLLRIHRPGRAYHTCYARFLEPKDAFAWVSLDKKQPELQAPDEATYRKADKARHLLLPLSQLHTT